MAQHSVSYGEQLPDSEFLLNTRVSAIIELYPTIQSFLALRASLERDFAKKLSDAASKARLHAINHAAERVGGQKGSNTLESAYLRFIESADLDAREHLAFADTLQAQVIDTMGSAGAKLENVRKRSHAFSGKLLTERDRIVNTRNSSKQKYFDSCETLESSRQKKAAAKDERQTEKASRAYDLAMDDMLIAKNQFLIDTDQVNVATSRLYNTDLPALHDDFQLLESQSILNLVHLWQRFTSVQRNSLAKLGDIVGVTEGAVAQVSVEEDQALFVDANSGRRGVWELPADVEFEASTVWHEDSNFSTSPPSIVYLNNVKLKALAKLGELNPVIESKRREVAGLRNLRDAYEKDRNLGDVGSVLENLFESVEASTLVEIQQTELKAQVEIVTANLGDEGNSNLKLHDFHGKSFVSPVTCVVCGGSLWGKGRACRTCGCAVHAKCELKVPAGCGTKAGTTLVRGSSSKRASTSSASPSSSSSAAPSVGSSRTVPPPTRASPAAVAPPARTPTSQTATMLYAYEASTAFELSVNEGDVVRDVGDVDESGWRKVSTADGRTGLVPDSYLQLGGGAGAQVGAEVAAGQEVVALYAYTAAGDDELSVVEGERLTLTNLGMDYGDGWAEATKGGTTGLIPSSYIQLL